MTEMFVALVKRSGQVKLNGKSLFCRNEQFEMISQSKDFTAKGTFWSTYGIAKQGPTANKSTVQSQGPLLIYSNKPLLCPTNAGAKNPFKYFIV